MAVDVALGSWERMTIVWDEGCGVERPKMGSVTVSGRQDASLVLIHL